MSDWKGCTALEAHQAWADKTHDVDHMYCLAGAWEPWYACDGDFRADSLWRYRIREKVNTITVEMPRPIYVRSFDDKDGKSAVVQLFQSHDEASAALSAFETAMGVA